MSGAPLRLILDLFRLFCHPAYREDLQGDLTEQFYANRPHSYFRRDVQI